MNLIEWSNVLVIVLCVAVLIQATRVMLVVGRMRRAGVSDLVKVLDDAVIQSRAVLGDLRTTLATEGAAHAKAVAHASTLHGELTGLRNELDVMIGVGNAIAERIENAVVAGTAATTAKAEQGNGAAHTRAKDSLTKKESSAC